MRRREHRRGRSDEEEEVIRWKEPRLVTDEVKGATRWKARQGGRSVMEKGATTRKEQRVGRSDEGEGAMRRERRGGRSKKA